MIKEDDDDDDDDDDDNDRTPDFPQALHTRATLLLHVDC